MGQSSEEDYSELLDDRGSLQQSNDLTGAKLEPLLLLRAIPNIKQRGCLAEMEVNSAGLEDDRELLQSMMAGEEQGFTALYRKYQAPVYRFALQVSGVRHIAEEAMQETFLSLIRSPGNYRSDRGPLLLYLFGIARRLVWKSSRRDSVYSPLEDDRDLPVSSADFAQDLAQRDQAQRLHHAILSLPRKYREVIVLCSLEELSYEQAAAVVGSSIGTIRSRMHRGKQLLMRKLRDRVSGAAVKNELFLSCPRGLDYDL